MKLCAYLYLGFTTKEIAAYTFKAIKTIENNRYHLRKRLGLSPGLDITLSLWPETHKELNTLLYIVLFKN